MTINSTGPISLAGTTTGQSIEIELGGNGTTQISLNDSNVRGLAGIASGQIAFNTFYGLSNVKYYLYAAQTNNICNTGMIPRSIGFDSSCNVYVTSQTQLSCLYPHAGVLKLSKTLAYITNYYYKFAVGTNGRNYTPTSIIKGCAMYMGGRTACWPAAFLQKIKIPCLGLCWSYQIRGNNCSVYCYGHVCSINIDSSCTINLGYGGALCCSCCGIVQYNYVGRFSTSGTHVAGKDAKYRNYSNAWFSGGFIDTSGNFTTISFAQGQYFIETRNSSYTITKSQRFGDGNGYGYTNLQGFVLDNSGNLYFYGGSGQSSGFGLPYFACQKWSLVSGTWTLQWARVFGGSSAEGTFSSGVVDSSGNFYVAGFSNYPSYTYYLLKYNSSGVLQYQRSFTVSRYSQPPTLGIDAEGAIFMAGCLNNSTNSGFVATVYKLDAAGAKTSGGFNYGTGVSGLNMQCGGASSISEFADTVSTSASVNNSNYQGITCVTVAGNSATRYSVGSLLSSNTVGPL